MIESEGRQGLSKGERFFKSRLLRIALSLSSLTLLSPGNADVDKNEICDIDSWEHVHNPSRLIPQGCIEIVMGKITYRHNNEDGDVWMLLKVDPGFEYLLNRGNMQQTNGRLVVEAICQVPNDKDECSGYDNVLEIPKVGSHVAIRGTYVKDTEHSNWGEIHPIESINLVLERGAV